MSPAPADTVLYAIDDRGFLVKVADPNTGVVTDVGSLQIGTTISSFSGFDIHGASGEAYTALIRSGDAFSTLYSIDLTTGKATSLGRIGTTIGPVTSLVVK